MNERGRRERGDGGDNDATVRAHESRPGRVVLTDTANADAWIASDLAVEPEP